MPTLELKGVSLSFGAGSFTAVLGVSVVAPVFAPTTICIPSFSVAPLTCVRVPSVSPVCTRTGVSAPFASSCQSVVVESDAAPVDALRTLVRAPVAAAMAGLKRSAALGTVSASFAEPTRNLTVAVMPGSSLPSGFATATTAV